jgi:hypothetical protein
MDDRLALSKAVLRGFIEAHVDLMFDWAIADAFVLRISKDIPGFDWPDFRAKQRQETPELRQHLEREWAPLLRAISSARDSEQLAESLLKIPYANEEPTM